MALVEVRESSDFEDRVVALVESKDDVVVLQEKTETRASRSAEKRPAPASQDDDPEGCLICYEALEGDGEHRAAALRCGHVFGRHCIESWLSTSKAAGRCPKCNAPALRRDVLPLFAARLVALDAGERHALEAQLRAERASADALQARVLRLEVQHAEMRAQLDAAQQQLAQSPGSTPAVGHAPLLDDLSQIRQVHVGRLPSGLAGRCAAYSEGERVFAIGANGRDSSSLVKVSLLDRTHTESLAGHRGQVRAVCAGRRESAWRSSVLSTGFDSRLVMTSLETGAQQISFSLSAHGWACAFDPVRDALVYAGLGNGCVEVWDLRAAHDGRPLRTLALPSASGASLPVHSLAVFGDGDSRVLFAATAAGPAAVSLDASGAPSDVSYAPKGLLGPGQCCALAAAPAGASSYAVLASTRGPARHTAALFSPAGWTLRHSEDALGLSPAALRPDIVDADERRFLAALPGAQCVRLRSLTRPDAYPPVRHSTVAGASGDDDGLDEPLDAVALWQPGDPLCSVFGRRSSAVRPVVLGVLSESSLSVYV